MDERFTHPAGRLLQVAALLGLVASAATALSRVFRAEGATAEIILVALAALAIAVATSRLRLVLSAPLAIAAVGWLIAQRAIPGSLDHGIPRLRTVAALGGSLARAVVDARTALAPVSVTPPFLVAALAGIAVTALLAHALLTRARRPLLALMPPLVPVAVADLALGRGASGRMTLGLVVSALGLVLADGVVRAMAHGRVEPPLRIGGAALATTRGARLSIAAVTAIAIAVPGLLPGAGTEPLLDLTTPGTVTARLEPFVSIRAQLEDGDRRALFRVRSDGGGAYWRLFALDRFDGTTWSASAPALSEPIGGEGPLPFSQGVPSATQFDQEVELLTDGVGGGWLPLAYPGTWIRTSGSVRFDAAAGTVVVDPAPRAGDRYEVRSARLAPTPAALDAVRFLAAEAYGDATALPIERRDALTRIASRWAGEASTPYRQVLAIQARFLDGSFRYSLEVPRTDDGDALLRFLRRDRVGFCQQFATAMAALVRALGYPARVAVGFREGERRGDVFTVSNRDAHAWVEVFFPGVGWLAFEPTPGRRNPAALPGSYLRPEVAAPGSGETDPTEAAGDVSTDGDPAGRSCLRPDGTILPAQLCRDGEAVRGTDPVGGRDDGAGPLPLRTGILLASIVLLAAFPLVRRERRRRRLRGAGDSRARTLTAFTAFAESADDLGLGRDRGETLAEYADRIIVERPDLDAGLRVLVALTARAAYAAGPPDEAAATRAIGAARAVGEEMRRGAGWRRRLLGAYGVRPDALVRATRPTTGIRRGAAAG